MFVRLYISAVSSQRCLDERNIVFYPVEMAVATGTKHSPRLTT